KGYIGTGWSAGTGQNNDFWEYNPSTNTWTQKANFGGGRRIAAAGFSIGNKGYIGTGSFAASMSDFWEYDPSTNAWTQKANFGGRLRGFATGVSIGDKGYIRTGTDNIGVTNKNDFWEYTPLLNSITTNSLTGSPLCAGNPVSVSFTTIGTANVGNTFTAQL